MVDPTPYLERGGGGSTPLPSLNLKMRGKICIKISAAKRRKKNLVYFCENYPLPFRRGGRGLDPLPSIGGGRWVTPPPTPT